MSAVACGPPFPKVWKTTIGILDKILKSITPRKSLLWQPLRQVEVNFKDARIVAVGEHTSSESRWLLAFLDMVPPQVKLPAEPLLSDILPNVKEHYYGVLQSNGFHPSSRF